MPPSVAARPVAVATWEYYLPLLVGQRVMTKAHRIALERLCVACADAVWTDNLKGRVGYTPVILEKRADGSERYRENPIERIGENADKRISRWASHLGLTPATVGKVSSAPYVPEQSPLARLRAERTSALRRVK